MLYETKRKQHLQLLEAVRFLRICTIPILTTLFFSERLFLQKDDEFADIQSSKQISRIFKRHNKAQPHASKQTQCNGRRRGVRVI